MNRLALALAVSVLGTGCIVTDDDVVSGEGSIVVYWTSFARHAPAVQGGFIYYDDITDPSYTPPAGDADCPEAGVDFVRVTPPGGAPFTVRCVFAGEQGVQIDRLPAGSHDFVLEGLRGGFVLYQTVARLDVIVGQVNSYDVDVEGVEARFDLFAHLAFGTPGTLYPSCQAAGFPEIDFTIRDLNGFVIDAGTTPCGDPMPALVLSDYLDLDEYDVRLEGYDAGNVKVFDSCWQPLDHFEAQTGAGGFAPTLFTLPVPSC